LYPRLPLSAATVSGDHAHGRTLELALRGVLVVGQDGAGRRRRPRDRRDDVDVLPREVGDAHDHRALTAGADVDAGGEQALRSDRLDVRKRAKPLELRIRQHQRLGLEREVGELVRRDLTIHRLLHQPGHGEDADAGHGQRQGEDREEGPRSAAGQVRERLA
jgi:hypothetical protein